MKAFKKLSKYGKWYRKARGKLIKKHGGKCVKCGSKSKLEFAYKKPNGLTGKGRGSFVRLKSIRDNPDDYILLCFSCHYEFDMIIITVGNHLVEGRKYG